MKTTNADDQTLRNPPFYKYLLAIIVPLMLLFNIATIPGSAAAGRKKLDIKDYSKHLNRKFKKEKRKSTKYIIIHTSEAGLTSTLRTLSQGKQLRGKFRTFGGHAHYAIARDGIIYRIMNHRYRADHAGLSMWDGVEDISSHSVAVELVGFHYGEITDAQYLSLGGLVKTLQKVYDIGGKNVLTHSQVSYGKPNQWHRRPHRGRKRCALNFDRSRIGLEKDIWTFDPDVKAGRLAADSRIYEMFYKPFEGGGETPKIPAVRSAEGLTIQPAKMISGNSNIVSKNNTAWNIAGEDYDSPDTLYILPDKREFRGDKIGEALGWYAIPRGTLVMLNQPVNIESEMKKSPIYKITADYTAWSYAGKGYNAPSTFYFFTSGGFVPGTRVEDWDSLPAGTLMIVDYKAPVEIGAGRGQTPWSIAGRNYNRRETLYYIPTTGLTTGDAVADFNDLPNGTMIFLYSR